MATDAEDQPSPVPEALTDADSNDTGSDSDSDSGDSPAPQVEWLATARAKRSTAGNRMKSMLANEEPADEDSDLELLFQEDEDDAGFSDKGQDDGSDAQMDSSDDEDENGAEAEDEGEKELQRKEREKKLAARKRKAQEAIPARFRKKVRISQPATPTSTTAQPPKPRPKKKSERASWLPSAADMPTRSSDRKTTRLSKEQLHNQMVEREERRKKQMELMEKKAKKLEAMKKPPMTQEERLAEAAIVEKRNAKSLNRWEEAEKVREEERRAKLAALNNRRLEGPVVTMWSGIVDLSDTQLKNVGKLVSIEEKPKRKRPSAAASTAANTAATSPKPDRPSTAVSTAGTATTASPKTETAASETALPTPAAQDAPTLPPVQETPGEPGDPKEEPTEPSERITEQMKTEKPTTDKPTAGQSTIAPDIGPRFMPPPNPHLTQSPQPSVLAPPVVLPPIPTPAKLSKKQQKEAQASAKKAAAKSAAPKKPPPPPEPPEPEPPLEGKVTRSCIILQDFDQEAIKKPDVQTQILFGRKMTKLAKPPHAPLCVITNHPARYRDPKTGLPFYNTYAFKEIQKLMAGDFKWSQLTGTWVGRGDDAASGVPARFTRPETEDERKERLERKEREKKEAEERKEQEEKLAAEEKARLEASGPPTTEASPAPMAPMAHGGADTQPVPVASGSVSVPGPVLPAVDGAGAGPPPPVGVPPVMPSPDDAKAVALAPLVPEQTPTTGGLPTAAAPTAAIDTDTVMTPAPPLRTGMDQTG
ncbi:putative yl1-domain-containing protein [Diaporthe ampelina]|uniref:Putative yl1-domain-containing protein n=1 Tax=Diaporthe ampelina TaxID=1214573 RepID=A0A0G2FC82_9PEZI|nr:putative yl1-domain-containing protein [Diaporthe ampelina]